MLSKFSTGKLIGLIIAIKWYAGEQQILLFFHIRAEHSISYKTNIIPEANKSLHLFCMTFIHINVGFWDVNVHDFTVDDKKTTTLSKGVLCL